MQRSASSRHSCIHKIEMAIICYTHADFLLKGLELAGFSEQSIKRNKAATNLFRYVDKYYATPQVSATIFRDIQMDDIGENKIENARPEYLLLAFYYLKKYPTKYEMAGYLDVCEETALRQSRRYVRAIQALRSKKVKWIFDNPELKEKYILSVDGVHCRIFEPRIEPSTKWYSKKFNKAGLTYELGIAIFHDQLVWINGPFPAGENDMLVFRKDGGLMSIIPKGKLVVADEGYRGEPNVCSTRNTFDDDDVKRFKKRVKARHESFNCRVKSFGILNQPFRSTGDQRLVKHETAFVACCIIVQYEMDNGRPLFKV